MLSLPIGRVPIIPLMGAPGCGLTGTTLKQNLTSADCQYDSLSALLHRFGPDGLFLFMDLTVEGECLGLSVQFPDNENPSVAYHPVKDLETLESLKRNWKGIGGRMPVFLKTMEKLAGSSGVVNGGYVIGPLTLAGELMGVNDLALASITNEDLVVRTVDFAFDVVQEYAQALLNAGADVIAVLEPTAVIFSPQQFRKLCAGYFMRLQQSLGTRLILHVCGDTTRLLDEMVATNALGLSLDSTVDFAKAIDNVPPEMFLIGNISPVTAFLNGTTEDVERDVKRLLSSMEGKSNFILSSGCDLPMDVPPENIDAFMRAGRTTPAS